MLNYYRAVLKKPLLSPSSYRIACRALVIWGKRDAYGSPELAESSIQLCADGRLAYLDQATHWTPHDEPQRVVDLLVDFLGSQD